MHKALGSKSKYYIKQACQCLSSITWETESEAGELWVHHPWWDSEFKPNIGYVKLSQNKKKNLVVEAVMKSTPIYTEKQRCYKEETIDFRPQTNEIKILL